MLALAKHFAPVQAPPDASEAGATRLAALWKLSQTNRCRPKSKDRHLPSLKVAAKDAGLKGDAYHYLEVDGKKRKILKNNEYLVARILQVEGHESAIPAGWLQCQPVGEKRTVTAPMVAAGSAADFRPFHRSNRSLPGNDCVAYLKSWKRHLAEGQCLVKHWQDWGFMDGKRVWLQVVEGEGPLVQIPEVSCLYVFQLSLLVLMAARSVLWICSLKHTGRQLPRRSRCARSRRNTFGLMLR